jgi:hypothetical protein
MKIMLIRSFFMPKYFQDHITIKIFLQDLYIYNY